MIYVIPDRISCSACISKMKHQEVAPREAFNSCFLFFSFFSIHIFISHLFSCSFSSFLQHVQKTAWSENLSSCSVILSVLFSNMSKISLIGEPFLLFRNTFRSRLCPSYSVGKVNVIRVGESSGYSSAFFVQSSLLLLGKLWSWSGSGAVVVVDCCQENISPDSLCI